MALYNCRHSGDQYRITKFDSDMNPQGSYLVDDEACECPAGVRPTCRHREMLPKFIARDHIGDKWFYDYDRGGWVQMGEEWAKPESEEHTFLEGMSQQLTATFIYKDDGSVKVIEHQSAPTGATSLPEGESEPQVTVASVGADLPKGITMITLDSPDRVVDVYNAIADAVGEPQMPPSAKPFKRRF